MDLKNLYLLYLERQQTPQGLAQFPSFDLLSPDLEDVYFQLLPCSDFTESCMVDILSQIIDEPYYDILRTKQQLGYYVDASSRMTASVLGFCFIVKGDAVRAEEAECRVMEFLSEFHHTLKTRSIILIVPQKIPPATSACNN